MIWEDWERLYDNQEWYDNAADLDAAIIVNLEETVSNLKGALASVKEMGDARMEGLLSEIATLKEQLSDVSRRLDRSRLWGNIKTIGAVIITAVLMGVVRFN